MKIAYKAAGLMTLLSLITLLIILVIFSFQNNRLAIDNAMAKLSLLSKETAQHVGTRLEEKVAISLAFSSAPIVSDALLKSNQEYEKLSKIERDKRIEALNQQWKKSVDVNDAFIQKHLNNPLANYLKLQQANMPDLYGEIFLTNRFGAMIASTGKLTTLAHAHKYWWLEAFNDGVGKIFFDDRGFDESAGGYVVGIVVPIKVNNKIVGMLKSNVNVIGLLVNIVNNYIENNSGKLKIVRSGGLIVAAPDIIPLSESLRHDQVQYLDRKISKAVHDEAGEKCSLLSQSPVAITMGTRTYGFGGAAGSYSDHSKGNVGEGWHVVVSLDKEEALVFAQQTSELIVFLGVIFTLLIAVVAMFLGKMITQPLVKLTNAIKNIGRGDFDITADVVSHDEIGLLASSFNKMAINLKETMVSRDALREETKERKGLNDLLLESVDDGIFGVDKNGMCTFINPAAIKLLGYNMAEIINHPISVLISRGQREGGFIYCISRIKSGETTDSNICQCCFEDFWRKDGNSFSAEYNITSLKQGGEVIGAVVTFRDITERVRLADESAVLQRQLQQSQKMEAIGRLTGGLAHDFNNMLSAILGYSNLSLEICNESGTEKTLKKYIKEVIKAGDRSKDLVAKMLAFSRGDMNKIKSLKLNCLIEDVMQMLRATIPSSIELLSILPEHDVYVETDAVQLNQVIMNLVINARDSIGDENGIIEIGISKSNINKGHCSSCHESYLGDFVGIFVRDSGSGISNAIIENIFDPFYTTKEIGSGTGMGLSIVHGIVHASGGHIQLETEAENGTTITLFFPEAVMKSDEIEMSTEEHVVEKNINKGNILVVDDELQLGLLIKEQLSASGYEITLFTDPLEALEAFIKSPEKFDLVITDQTMPGMTGDDLSRQLLKIRKDIPIILSTGFSSKINEEEALAIGISRFMEKPLSKENLLEVIGQLLQN